MNASFHFAVSADGKLLRVTLAGFFSSADVARFAVALNAAQRTLRSASNQHVTCVDIREMQIQSQESVAAFQKVLAIPARKGKAIAFVVSQSLARMQAQRVANGREANFFASVGEATMWLVDQQMAAAA